VQLLGEVLVGRDLSESRDRVRFIRRGLAEIAVEAQRALHSVFAPAIVEDEDEHDIRPDGVQPEFEGGHNAEVTAAAAQSPQQVGVLGGAGMHQPAIGGYDLRRDQVVAAQAVGAAQPAIAAAQRQPGDARPGIHAARRRQTVRLRRRVDVAPRRAASDADRSPGRVDLDLLHLGEIDDDAPVVGRVTGHVVPAAPNREQQIVLAGEVDRRDDV